MQFFDAHSLHKEAGTLRNACPASHGPWSTNQSWLKRLRRQHTAPADVEGRLGGVTGEHRTFHHWPGHAHAHASLCWAFTVPPLQRPEWAFVLYLAGLAARVGDCGTGQTKFRSVGHSVRMEAEKEQLAVVEARACDNAWSLVPFTPCQLRLVRSCKEYLQEKAEDWNLSREAIEAAAELMLSDGQSLPERDLAERGILLLFLYAKRILSQEVSEVRKAKFAALLLRDDS